MARKKIGIGFAKPKATKTKQRKRSMPLHAAARDALWDPVNQALAKPERLCRWMLGLLRHEKPPAPKIADEGRRAESWGGPNGYEVLGRAMLVRATGFDSSIALKAPRDTFTPQFAGPPSWGGIPLDGTVRLSVELSDDDVLFPDPMGSFQLNTADLVYALRAQNIVNVRVDGQTNRQILFAAISVMPE